MLQLGLHDFLSLFHWALINYFPHLKEINGDVKSSDTVLLTNIQEYLFELFTLRSILEVSSCWGHATLIQRISHSLIMAL